MNKKKIVIISISIIIMIILIGLYIYLNNWPYRFKNELDAFFGKGNWKYISSETKESRMYNVRVKNSRDTYENRPGSFKNWDILVKRNDKKELWTITNHTLKINHDKYYLLSPKRYSAKEAFILELMEISTEIAEEEVTTILSEVLPNGEIEGLSIHLSYHNGNPKPNFYKKLWQEDWFKMSKISASEFLKTELYDFYLDISLYDYKLNKMTETKRNHVLNSLPNLTNKLLETYGNSASFKIYFDKTNQIEYENGQLIENEYN